MSVPSSCREDMAAPTTGAGCLKIWAEQTHRHNSSDTLQWEAKPQTLLGLGHQPMAGIWPDTTMESQQSGRQRVKIWLMGQVW